MGRRFTQTRLSKMPQCGAMRGTSGQVNAVVIFAQEVQGTLENAIEFLIILKISVHLRPKLLRVKGENWGYLLELVVGYRSK